MPPILLNFVNSYKLCRQFLQTLKNGQNSVIIRIGDSPFSSSSILKELIKITRYHTVIELLYLVRFFAVEALEALVRGYNVYLPGCERAEMSADVAVERLDLGERAESFAIGRVGDYRAAATLGADRARILLENPERI